MKPVKLQWAVLILWGLGTWWVGRGIHWYYLRPFQIVRRTLAKGSETGQRTSGSR